MKYFNLDPSCGWDGFSRNSELADFIYDTCLEKVNEGGWSYINPMSNMGIFEDENGNYLCLETYDKGDINSIHEMHAGLNDDKYSVMNMLIRQLETDFGLARKTRE